MFSVWDLMFTMFTFFYTKHKTLLRLMGMSLDLLPFGHKPKYVGFDQVFDQSQCNTAVFTVHPEGDMNVKVSSIQSCIDIFLKTKNYNLMAI